MEVKLGFLKWNFGSNLCINYLPSFSPLLRGFLCNRVVFQLKYIYDTDLELREEQVGH